MSEKQWKTMDKVGKQTEDM